MWPRVNPFEGIDAQLRHLIQAMLDCPVSAAGLVQMKNLLWRRDQLLEQRHAELAGRESNSGTRIAR